MQQPSPVSPPAKAGLAGGADPGSAVFRTYGVNALTSAASNVWLVPSLKCAVVKAELG